MPNPDATEIAIILDRSGSMESIREDMIGGFKAFIDGQREQPGSCVLSLYQFDDRYEVVYEAKPLRSVKALRLEPRGSTALLDGVGRSIALIAARHEAMPERRRPAAVIVVVITDGHENASTEWNLASVHKAVTAAQRERDWRFVFLGADASAFADAQRMGIAAAAHYERTAQGVGEAYDMLGTAASAYRGARRVGDADAKLEMPKPAGDKPHAKRSRASARS